MNGPLLLPVAEHLLSELDPAEFNRLLGLPRERVLEGDLAERAEWARTWYSTHARPCLVLRRFAILEIGRDGILLEGEEYLGGTALADYLRRYEAHALLCIAASAGAEVDDECAACWRDGRLDQGYFLDRLGATIAEQLVGSSRAGTCHLLAATNECLTPHLSPGCGGWSLDHQGDLYRLLAAPHGTLPLRILTSGGLVPSNAILAVAGITHRVVSDDRLACARCNCHSCRYRRVPFGGDA